MGVRNHQHRVESPHQGRTSQPSGHGVGGFLPSFDLAMRLVEEQALRVADSDETVLLLGETGVGKDVLARRVHLASSRKAGPFVQINCAALPEGLLESELFGHVRGAYTGATDSQQGQFEAAHGGTIFLDEIAELGPRLQAKLLLVLQERMFHRVGGRDPIRVDSRFIAATNQDLDKAMAEGSFRRDLYYRLCVVSLTLPPLRDRPSDIEALTCFFASRYSSQYNKPLLAHVGDDIIEAMMRHRFEGNVRELENLVKRAILLGGYDVILEELGRSHGCVPEMEEALAPGGARAAQDQGPVPLKQVARRAMEEAERSAIVHALSTTRWNRRRAARLLKVSYRSLLYKIAGYSIMPGRPGISGTPGAGLPLAHHGKGVS